MSKAPDLSVAFADFPGPFNPDRISRLLRRRFTLSSTSPPDYVIYSVAGHDHLRYKDAIRIFFTGENVHPDFNLCDYAFGYDWMELGDRYYRCPNYQLYDQFHDLCARRRSQLPGTPLGSAKPAFCNFIYTSRDAHPVRDQFFGLLNRYRKVDSAGAHLNNTGFNPGLAYHGDWPAQKVAFQSRYKFTIAFENSSTPGYTTEKIVHALAADTIPIYWGNPEIGREFNLRRFINYRDYPDADAVVARVREIDQDDDLFRSILVEPFFPDDTIPASLQDEAILKQFEHIFSQPKEQAVRRNPYAWGRKYEHRRITEVQAWKRLERLVGPFRPVKKAMRRLLRRQTGP